MSLYLYALVPIGLFLLPLVLLYRILNPPPTPKKKTPERRIIGARFNIGLHSWHFRKTTAEEDAARMAWHASEEALDQAQIEADARQKAIHDAEIARQNAEQAAWNASTMGRATKKIGHALGWIIAAPFILLFAAPFILLGGWFVAAIGLKVILIFAAIILLCNSIKADIKEEIQEELRAGTPTAK